MTWAEASASLQLEAELRRGARDRLLHEIAQGQVDASNGAADAAMRGMLG